MDPRAIRQIAKAADKAERALRQLHDTTNLDQAEEAWEEFLAASSRVYEKLRSGSKGCAKSWQWFNDKQKEREDDELLRYIHYARNAHQHRLEEIVAREEPMPVFAIPNGEIRGLRIGYDGVPSWDSFVPSKAGERPFVGTFPGQLKLIPVTDRNNATVPIPTTHRGRKIPSDNPLRIGQMALTYLRRMIAEASAL